MRFWPSRNKTVVPEKLVRDGDVSLDQWASYFNFDGSVYPTNAFGASSGLSAFGGYPSDTTTGNKEEALQDFSGYVNGGYKASAAVFACCRARASLFTEAHFAIQKITENGPGDFVAGDLSILERPWPGGVTSTLLARAIQDVDMAGNAYFVRAGSPGNERLRRLRPDWVCILLDGDPHIEAHTDVVAYIYKPGNTADVDRWEIYPIDGSNGLVAHWAPIMDPEAQHRGMSWITPIIREISTDKAIAQHKLRFFQNGAQPGMVVAFDAAVTPEQTAAFTEKFNQTKIGVNNAYRPMFLGGGATVTPFSGNMEDFKNVASVGEVRIASVAGVPPIVVGFSEALKGSALNEGNFKSSKDLFADATIRPMWGSFCAVLEPLINVADDERLWYSDKDIAFLREDQQIVAQRQATDAATLSSLTQAGFTPESAVQSLIHKDWTLLVHSGLFSIQLMAPGEGHDSSFKGSDPTAISSKPPPSVAGKGVTS